MATTTSSDLGSDLAAGLELAPAGDGRAQLPRLDRSQWNAQYALQDFLWTTKANPFVVFEADHLRPGNALDLAAGEGRNAVWLAEKGWKVRAVDFSDVALRKAARLAEARSVAGLIELIDADLEAYEPGRHEFDLVLLAYLQLPQEALVPILQRAARAVAAGGTFLLLGHDSANLEHGFGGPRHPKLLYTAAQVVAAVRGELEIEKARRVYRPLQAVNGPQVAVDCLVRAHRPL